MSQQRCTVSSILFPRGLREVPAECSFAIVLCRDSAKENVILKGALSGLRPEMEVEAEGEWKTDSYGRHLRVTSWNEVIPTGVKGIEAYLASGLIKGIGPKRAALIVKAFGKDTFQILDTHPERLREIDGIGRKHAAVIASSWGSQKGIRDIMAFLKEYGVTNTLAAKIFKQYGDGSVSVLREDPYRMADDIKGVGFLTADQLALSMGLDSQGSHRCRSGVIYALEQFCEKAGHVFCPQAELTAEAASLLAVPEELVTSAIEELVTSRKLRREEGSVYLPAYYFCEKGVAGRLAALLAEPERCKKVSFDMEKVEKKSGLSLESHQTEGVRLAASSPVSILTGGPGTGKTTTTKAMLEAFRTAGCRILLAAPTGRAAKRLSETTHMEARTIHRLLEYSPMDGYVRNEDNPLTGDVLIVDESSMVDIVLMNALLKAVPVGMRVVFIGDVDQLPSVGSGNVLRDMIESGAVPTTRLTKIFRQAESSRIVTGAHRINSGLMPDLSNSAGTDFFFIPKEKISDADNKEAIADAIIRSFDRMHDKYGLAYSDIQVLSPMRATACIGTNALNLSLQDHINAENAGHKIRFGSTEFRLNDRVMQIRNNYDKGVFNGDVGYITGLDCEERTMAVRFEDSIVEYKGEELSDLVLSYATTVHKSQGSECPAVIIPVSRSFSIMNQRNLLYTAVTRAKRYCILIGERQAVADMVRNDRIQKRYSMLAERLQAANGIK